MTRRISSSRPMTGSILPVAGAGGEVLAVLLQRLELLLGVLRRDAVRAADLLQDLQQLLGADAEALVHGQQQVLDGEEVVAQVLLELLGGVEDVVELAAEARLVAAVGLGQLGDGLVGLVAHHQRGLAELGRAPARRPCRPGAVRAASTWSGVSSGLELPFAWSMAAAIASCVLSVHFLGSSAMVRVYPRTGNLSRCRIKFGPASGRRRSGRGRDSGSGRDPYLGGIDLGFRDGCAPR